tara:strand:+ start:602 stop:1723 length:1122 start_codon:yes stop_codon:yes gene_type:complete
MHKVLVIFGTRPEIIKLKSIVKYLKNSNDKKFNCKVLYTNQHKEMGTELSNIFKIKYDILLNRKINKKISFEFVDKIYDILKLNKINSIVVMGDTLSGTTGAIAGYLNQSKIFYVESGLRTGDYNQPWPEEGFRKVITHLSNIHFAPTIFNKKILIEEGIRKENIFVTGNPVIDTIKDSVKYINKPLIRKKIDKQIIKELKYIPKEFVLVTIHRRENFGKAFERICKNINYLSKKYKNLKFIYPVHPNPYVKKTANKLFSKNKNILLIKPSDYFTFLRLMQLCKFIISDSGGIQEECTIINKYVLLVRNKTERPEILNKLVFVGGSNYNLFKKYFAKFLKTKPKKKYTRVFGNGNSSKLIAKIILKNCLKEND